MSHHPIVIACRDAAEAELLRAQIGESSIPVFYKSAPFLNYVDATPNVFVVSTSLILDENATGLLTKLAILSSKYNILVALHGAHSPNILRSFGCGCFAILGPEDLASLPMYMQPDEAMLNALVIPPFFIDDDESNLKEPPLDAARPLHVTVLGAQSMMSLSNALLNIEASPLMSFACVAPQGAWLHSHLEDSVTRYTRWNAQSRVAIKGGSVTFCQDMGSLLSLEPSCTHIIICHGLLNEMERYYVSHQPEQTRVFTACDEGYLERQASGIDAMISPESLWDLLITALYPS